MTTKINIIIVLTIIFLPVLSSADFTYVIANSEDWKDVYSTINYANLNGVGSDFLVSTNHGSIILNGINKQNNIRVTTSEDKPYVFNYPDLIKSNGFEDADEITSKNLNIDLAKNLEEINNFIIVGDSYGYNPIAVVPYAMQTRSWVFLANKMNVYEIDSILSKKNGKILLYGFMDSQVTEVLLKYNPEIINTGDKFQDNIEIVEKYLTINPVKQVVLTNGEFIEKELMSGAEPILFTGKENVPDQIRDYLKDSIIEVGVLIGNDLIGAATNIRKSTGISVMVKFARGARTQTSGVSAVEGLDLFPLPTPTISLEVYSIKYNKINSQLELTIKSNSNIPSYFKSTITINADSEQKKVGDLEPIFIAPGDYKTAIYPLEVSSENLKATINILFGETKYSLDRVIEKTLDVEIISILDVCKLTSEDIKQVSYNKQKKEIQIKTKNNAEIDCWVDVEITDMIIGNSEKTIGTDGSIRIAKGKTKTISISQELTENDLEQNPLVDLIVYSGEKEDSLAHAFKGRYKLDIQTLTLLTYAIIILIIAIIILVAILIVVKRKEDSY